MIAAETPSPTFFFTAYPLLDSAAWFLAAYLLGSCQVAWLLAKVVVRKDLRELGSGNIGVMNSAVSIARWAGLVVFLCEISKGVLAVWVPSRLGAGEPVLFLTIVGVVAGTRWPVWLSFKGGRGNTCGFSALALINFYIPVLSLLLWGTAYIVFNGSFKATRTTLISLPAVIWILSRSEWFLLAGILLSGIYLLAQKAESDDHLIINRQYDSFLKFLFSAPRQGKEMTTGETAQPLDSNDAAKAKVQ
jgi:acyl phosphate:glycerol-3-phosphate acyltransferase